MIHSSAKRYSPETIFWEVTNRCNLSCSHCYNSSFLNDKQYTLSLENGVNKCEDIIAAGVKKVVFLGGEPLADKNIFVYIHMLTASNVNVSITTNGTLIDREKAKLLADLKVSLISVSLDGGNEMLNDRIRGKGTFKKIIRGLSFLTENRTNNLPRIAISCTLAPENYGNYEDLFNIALQFNIVDIFINKYSKVKNTNLTEDSAISFLREMDKLCAKARSMGNFFLYLPTMPKVADFLGERHSLKVISKERSCPAVDDALLLSDDGKIYPCSMARVEHDDYGAEYDSNFETVSGSKEIQKFVTLRKQLRKQLPPICRECSYRDSCATICTLSDEQTKYYEACEALELMKDQLFDI